MLLKDLKGFSKEASQEIHQTIVVLDLILCLCRPNEVRKETHLLRNKQSVIRDVQPSKARRILLEKRCKDR